MIPPDLDKLRRSISDQLQPVVTPMSLRELPPIPRNPLIVNMEQNQASEFHNRLAKWINEFNSSLDEQHDVGIRLVNFGQTVVFHLARLGYWNPSLMWFAGTTDNGDPVELIQHVSQISILLMKLPRRDPTKPKTPIGFHAGGEASADESAGQEPA